MTEHWNSVTRFHTAEYLSRGEYMLKMREADFEHARREWEFIKEMPADENGMTNPWAQKGRICRKAMFPRHFTFSMMMKRLSAISVSVII